MLGVVPAIEAVPLMWGFELGWFLRGRRDPQGFFCIRSCEVVLGLTACFAPCTDTLQAGDTASSSPGGTESPSPGH